ncbi:MAG: hypothetical protein NC084_04005 [Bacteroides sp.]|nr:hypothetical protein [Eubacterium sp.]MCM1417670.1 hypothetical protein [Roseburia sp.]MCM1461864.1 hypothetical protein [Bacteroides sp.]
MARINDKINNLTGKDEAERKLKEQFSFLQKMAKAKCAQFEAELREMFSEKKTSECEVVGNRAITYYDGQHVDIHAGCDKAIKQAIDLFFKGGSDVNQGFQKLITTALDTLIGDTSIGEQEKKMFFVYPENFAIVRVDIKFYKYCFSSSGIIAQSENIFCYTFSKSIVDHKKIGIDELLYMATEMIGSDKIEEVEAFVKKLRSVWNTLEGKDPLDILNQSIQYENGLKNEIARLGIIA